MFSVQKTERSQRFVAKSFFVFRVHELRNDLHLDVAEGRRAIYFTPKSFKNTYDPASQPCNGMLEFGGNGALK